MTFPLGFGGEVLGAGAKRKAAQKRLVFSSIGAAAIIFALLVTSFGDRVLVGLVLVTLPMALVGGSIAPQLGDGVMSLGSLVGFRTVLGVATTGLALLPLVIAGNRPGNGIEHPMAVVILGGLVTATLLNLFVVPSLLPVFGCGVALPAPVAPTPQEATA